MPDPSRAVLVTGCSSGIGRATAERLATTRLDRLRDGPQARDARELEAAGCRTLALDVTDEASMQAAVAPVEAAEGAVGVLVNNAGYSQSGAIETVPMERVRAQFETNVFGLVRLTQLVLPGMREQRWGKIVNLSLDGRQASRSPAAASTTPRSTRWRRSPTRCASRSRGFGIDVVVVEPGLIRTSFGEAAATGMTGEAPRRSVF